MFKRLMKRAISIINNSSKREILKASDDTVIAENLDRREENTKSYRLTNGSNAVFCT